MLSKPLQYLREIKAMSIIGVFAPFFYILISVFWNPYAVIIFGLSAINLICLLFGMCAVLCLVRGSLLSNCFNDPYLRDHVIPEMTPSTLKHLKMTYRSALLTGAIGIFNAAFLAAMVNKSLGSYFSCLLGAALFGCNIYFSSLAQRGLMQYMKREVPGC